MPRLTEDNYVQLQAEHRTMAAFVLAMIVNNYPNGQVDNSVTL